MIEISFLHIGKNAGTQVKYVAKNLLKKGIKIKFYNHKVKLHELPIETKYFFSIREPASRFISGFYSRKRKGMPRLYSEWSLHEKMAFKDFEHANNLAENLFSTDIKGISALSAIKSISHTGMQQIDYFWRAAYFQIQPPIAIIRQEYFEEDMQKLLIRIGVETKISTLVTDDNIQSHKNDYSEIPPLSELARNNLKKWYVQDYMFYEYCEEWIKQKNLNNI